MESFSYVAGLTSIVIGLGIARTLTGVGRILQCRDQIKLYWVHLLWILNIFLFLVLNWWILFRWHNQTNWNFFLLLFVLTTPVIVFLLTAILIPDQLEDGFDLSTYFYSHRVWFFALGALVPPLDAIDTLLKGWDHFSRQGVIYITTIAVLTALSVWAAITRSRRYHAFYVVFFLIYLLFFISINLSMLG